MSLDDVRTLNGAIADLSANADNHFASCFKVAETLADAKGRAWSPSMINSNWSKFVTPDLVDAGEEIGRAVPPLSAKLVRLIQRSPLLSENDVRDVRRLTKEMMSALRFRRHREWNTDVIHDEGTVLGTTPAGQSDDEPLTIEDSQQLFTSSLGEFRRLLDFLVTEEEDLPAAIAATKEPAVVRFRPGTAFIIMWIDPTRAELEDVKEAIKDEFKKFGIVALRSDDIEHSGVITERILNEIAASEFLIADLTGERPSVYYEIGYAHAIGKRPILFRRQGTPLHFDLAVHNCPEYENLKDLRSRLGKRLEALTNRQADIV
jgi:hypothetical protein